MLVSILEPALGLIIWQVVIFGILFFILAKFAWKPIMSALQEREASIDDALSLAAKTRQEMTDLKAGNEKLIGEARAERDRLLKEAKEAGDSMIKGSTSLLNFFSTCFLSIGFCLGNH